MFLGFQSPMVMLSHPDAIRALYTERAHGLPPGRTFALRPIMGDRSVLLLEGAEHLQRRKVMLPPFHGERMRAYEPIVREAAEREIATWPSGDAVPHPPAHAGGDARGDPARGVRRRGPRPARRAERGCSAALLARTSSPALQFGMLAARRLGVRGPMERIERENAALDALLMEEIRAHGDDGDDILSLLKQARFEDGEPMSDREVRDQLVTLLLAGHETTATGLAWTFDLLLRHPDVHGAARRRGRRGRGRLPARGRVRGAAAAAGRAARRPPLERAARGRRPVAARRHGRHARDLAHAHARRRRYPDPYAFRPERFLDSPPQTYAWIPFGGGVRRCLGAAFAELEMRVVLAAVLRARALQRSTTRPERVARRNVTFSPARGTRLVADIRY